MNRRNDTKKIVIPFTEEEITFLCDLLYVSLKSWKNVCEPKTQATFKLAEQIFNDLRNVLLEDNK